MIVGQSCASFLSEVLKVGKIEPVHIPIFVANPTERDFALFDVTAQSLLADREITCGLRKCKHPFWKRMPAIRAIWLIFFGNLRGCAGGPTHIRPFLRGCALNPAR